MKTPAKSREEATALVVSMLVIFLVVAAIGIAMNLTNITQRQTDSSRDFSALRSAAEGTLDFGYGVWTKSINNKFGPVKNSDLTTALGKLPAFPTFTASLPLQITGTDAYGAPFTGTTIPPATTVNLDNYPGWVGRNTGYTAAVVMQGTFIGKRTVQYGAKRAFNYTVVPLFQATAFFEDNLELYHTAPMSIGGLVHTNSEAYVSSSTSDSSNASLTFTGNLSHVSGYVDGKWTEVDPITKVATERDAPPQAWNWTGYSANTSFPPAYANGGKDKQVDQVNRIEPLGADSATLLHPATDENGNPTGDKNPNDDSMREMIEPPTNTGAYPDPTPIADRRLYNKAGIRIHISSKASSKGKITYTTTVTTQNGTSLSGSQKNAIIDALSQSSIYDRREAANVDVTTLDVGAINSVLNGASGFNNIIYIDQTTNTGALSSTSPQAIRLTNGSTLPSEGLTVASQNPVYIQGDYNTSNQSTRGSAAVFADAVTILSNSWQDTNSAGDLSTRVASTTTVNTAIVAGFLPSGWTNPDTGAQYGYSGGLNNFPRFLEDWKGKTFNYTGSMIELFTSQVAIGEWDTGTTYVPPVRVWNFDSNFVDNPPPGSLDAVSIGRGALVRF